MARYTKEQHIKDLIERLNETRYKHRPVSYSFVGTHYWLNGGSTGLQISSLFTTDKMFIGFLLGLLVVD